MKTNLSALDVVSHVAPIWSNLGMLEPGSGNNIKK